MFPINDAGIYEKKLLIWDSFKCHLEKSVKVLLLSKNVFTAVIPGGCTSQIQTLDVCINRPFKVKMEDLFDDFMSDQTRHTYTRGGNMRSASNTQLCDMIVSAWNDIEPEIIQNSFKVCGQVPGIEVKDILSFKDGKTCSSGRAKLESLWHLDCDRIDINLLCIKHPEDIVDVDEFQGDNEEDVFVDSSDPLM